MKLDYLQDAFRKLGVRGFCMDRNHYKLIRYFPQKLAAARHWKTDISSVSDWKNVFNALNSYFRSNLRLKFMAISSLMQKTA